MVACALRGAGGALATDLAAEEKFDALPVASSAPGPNAFLTVQEGCDKFCTFCVVPYTRGAEYSRPPADVLREARSLAARGAREITRLGQDVNAYHAEGANGEALGLGDLIRQMAEIEGIDRLRYTTSHPRDMDEGLLAAHAEVPELMPFVHLPVQSGSDRVLAAMNRAYTADGYLAAVGQLRAARPDIALSSDFIVGFPGETDVDFQDTLDLVREVGFAQAYSFKYSPRPGTPAWAMDGQVPDAVKSARLQELLDLLSEQQKAFNAAAVGRTLPVLLERKGRHVGQLTGRSPYMQAVNLEADALRSGDVVDVVIVDALANSLAGRLAETAAALA
jgi:tRNA-2-methylthio-N6-dimethylallyladenosine synthase